jgi:hypothetical protein
MIGVDQSVQGRNMGRLLFADGLRRIALAATQIGIFAAVLNVLNDGDAQAIHKRTKFYEGFGFQSLPSQPLKMFMLVRDIRKNLE